MFLSHHFTELFQKPVSEFSHFRIDSETIVVGKVDTHVLFWLNTLRGLLAPCMLIQFLACRFACAARKSASHAASTTSDDRQLVRLLIGLALRGISCGCAPGHNPSYVYFWGRLYDESELFFTISLLCYTAMVAITCSFLFPPYARAAARAYGASRLGWSRFDCGRALARPQARRAVHADLDAPSLHARRRLAIPAVGRQRAW